MKKFTLYLTIVILLSSCARYQQSCKRETGTKRTYDVTLFSGGDTVFHDNFHGVVNQEDGDGIYYYKGDTLVEVAGDYVIKSTK